MPLDDDVIRDLWDLLKEATALVIVGERESFATAFFITDELLLTCGHAVPKGAEVTIQPFKHPSRPAEVIKRAEPDLALLRSPLRGDRPSQCVVLGPRLDRGESKYLVAASPSQEGEEPGTELFEVSGRRREDFEGVEQRLQIDPGVIIAPGMSGSPMASTRTGAVVAIIRSSRDTEDALGGGAIPISLAVKAFPEVEQALRETTLPMIPWREVLGRQNWQRLGRPWPIGACIDLRITGDRRRWHISVASSAGPGMPAGPSVRWEPPIPRSGPDLGEEVAEAIFHWAQQRHMRNNEEVELLGQLLASALFPGPVQKEMDNLGRGDHILVRLHVDPADDLADIPWELASVPGVCGRPHAAPGKRRRFIAADEDYRFARVVDPPDEPSDSPAPKPAADVRVLAAVAQPNNLAYKAIRDPDRPAPDRWPTADAMYEQLRDSIEGNSFRACPGEPPGYGGAHPTSTDVRAALKNAARAGWPYDVLHYMGMGQWGRDGKARLSFVKPFVDENGDKLEREEWEDADRLLETAAEADVRLVVIELLVPPEEYEHVPHLTCSAFSGVVTGGVKAAVLTSLPVRPDQCQKFNAEFYRRLGEGRSVETAAQLARYQVRDARQPGDAAGFGWFTVITGEQAGICLVRPQPESQAMLGLRPRAHQGAEPADESQGGGADDVW